MDPARLTRNPVFSALAPHELSRLAAMATEESYAVGKTLVRQGDYSTEMYVIQEGAADVIQDGVRLGAVGPGDVVGEIGVLEKARRSADVVVTEPLLAIKVTHWEIRRLAPETRARLQEIAERRKGVADPPPGTVLDYDGQAIAGRCPNAAGANRSSEGENTCLYLTAPRWKRARWPTCTRLPRSCRSRATGVCARAT
jgi:CRP/FNR family cyclic AMP-dependent transcriptional regulator